MRRPGDSRIEMRAGNQRPKARPGWSVAIFSLSFNFLRARSVRVSLRSFRLAGQTFYFAAELIAARALVVDHSTKQGNGTGKLPMFMADFYEFPFFGEAGHGIYR